MWLVSIPACFETHSGTRGRKKLIPLVLVLNVCVIRQLVPFERIFVGKTTYHMMVLGPGMEGHEALENLRRFYRVGRCAILYSLQEKVHTLGFKDAYVGSHRSSIWLELVI